VWKVVCDSDYWQRDDTVQFKHADTGAFLAASGQTFGRPISGQMEIIGSPRADGSTRWRTQEVRRAEGVSSLRLIAGNLRSSVGLQPKAEPGGVA
jgi:hypothetical protein